MGFRFRNLNPVYRTCITRLSPSKFVPPVLEPLNLHPPEFCFTSSENPAFKIHRRWHLGHSHHDDYDHHHHHLPQNQKEGENIFRLGLAADIGLATGKAFTGYLSGSTAIIADAAHSISDVVLSGIALLSFKVAKAPRDKEHPYGHGKFETLGALGISCMLLATGGGIAWHAVDLLMGLFSTGPEMVGQALAHEHVHSHGHGGHHHGIDMDHPILALNMTIVSICVKEGLYWITKQAGEKQGSGLMKANAWHHRADAISSVVALVGVGGSILGVKFLDPLAGLLVSVMILKAGAETGYQSVLELVDAAIPAQHLDPIKQTILQVDGVKGCHRLRGRRAGSSLYLDVNIEVDPFSSVSAAHDIGESVRHQIHKSHPTVAEIFIHIDPAMSHVSSSTTDQQDSWSGEMDQNNIAPAGDTNIEGIVSDIISSNFPQMSVERITRHMFQSKLVLQIEVSMPPDIPIRRAMEIAEQAENEILKAVSNIIHVGIQLRLGQPFPQINHS
ncbi:metal tolerance protein 2 [Abrus precatorius]|uniref:Metal tolerance protein 2 n=1 Tax=Abrus precatorius TaxID=3816 RepID=A0A8B8M845_ABRPR|nr:metal tolerance protein 2 [Abrus precatorius]